MRGEPNSINTSFDSKHLKIMKKKFKYCHYWTRFLRKSWGGEIDKSKEKNK